MLSIHINQIFKEDVQQLFAFFKEQIQRKKKIDRHVHYKIT